MDFDFHRRPGLAARRGAALGGQRLLVRAPPWLAKAGGTTREVYREFAELGLTGLAVPEAHGGLGFGAVEAMVVMEELGRGLVNAPYAAAALVAPTLLAAAATRQCRPPGCRGSPSAEALVVLGAPGARRALPAATTVDACHRRRPAAGR